MRRNSSFVGGFFHRSGYTIGNVRITPSSSSRIGLRAVTKLLVFSFSLFAMHPLEAASEAKKLQLTLQKRLAPTDGADYKIVTTPEQWDTSKTAIIVCDMWDLHHCKNAVRRVKEMAPRMNQFLEKARDQGVFIIHAPSSCM